MEKHVIFVICAIISSATAEVPYPRITKRYRTDYVYNQATDTFYKLHIESRSRAFNLLVDVCKVESAELMSPSDRKDIKQLHSMFKKFPDLGEYVWVADDDQDHESAEEQPLINLNQIEEDYSPELDKGRCLVVTRTSEVKTAPCYDEYPFICKVKANDAPYDRHCGVFGKDYKYIASVGSCYKIPRIAYTWSEAYSECQAEGAHLVVLNSENERQVIQNLTMTEQIVHGSRKYWYFIAGFRANKPTVISGNTTSTTRVFRTVFNQTLEEAGFNQWSATEPNNLMGNEYCGSINMYDGKLNDLNCAHKYGFICEKEVPQNNRS